MAKWIVLALIALSALPDAYTDGSGKCSQTCGQAPSHDFKINLQRGHTYVYNFEATTETSVPGATATSEDENTQGDKKPGGERLHITGQAELSAGPDCHHTMRLLHVQVTGADGKKFQDFQSCEKHPVGFSWNNGVLGDELCVEPDDNPSNLNVKRAILSLVQFSRIQSSGSAHAHETDIFGTCPTDYTFYEDGTTLKITKRRNLNRCAHREGLQNTFLTSSYNGPSHFQSTPLMDSNLQVEQTIKDHVLVSAVGHEDYLFRPFSNGASGARTTVTTKLTLVQHQPSPAPPVTNGIPSSVLFDSHNWNYGGANPEEEATVEMVSTALKNAEKASNKGVSVQSAGLFRRVVRVMRYASTKTLLEVYGQVKAGAGFGNKKTAKAIFTDALLQVGTGQSVEAAIQLINSEDIPQAIARLYYVGLSFVRHATRGSMKAASTLLESPTVHPEALLGIGALVGRYCSEHTCDDSVPEYKFLVGKLANKLGGGCKPANKEHENEIVGTLKGLQNAHKLTAEAAEAVAKCAASSDVPTRIRVAALDAVRGDPCNMKMKKRAMEMMKNKDLDSELRIKAYLAVVQCPCDKVAVAVKEMMDTEPINQVGSFVSSHLMTLRTSSNPEHAKAKHHLAGIRPKKRYPQDIRKFSRAFEVSYALDGLNMGSSAEGNVIFSQKSFVPRSAVVNLTTDIFGHSFNLMEVGIRAENVDHVLESLFGPRGYFKMHSANDVMNEGYDKQMNIVQQVKERLRNYRAGKAGKRGKRAVTREMVATFDKKVGHSVDHEDHSLDLDFHMKMFGSEVSWMNYHGNLMELMPEKLVDKFFDGMDDGINKAKDLKLDFSPNIAVFDTELIYPTGAGFSLSLAASAHTSVNLGLESHVDLPAIFKDPGNAKFKIKLMPSASVQVAGSMKVDALASVYAGLELLGTLHSSTGVEVDAKLLENGHGLDITVGVPKDKQEVFHIETQVVSKRRERHHVPVVTPVKFDRNRKDFKDCFDQLAPATGLVVCGEVGFPWDGFSSVVVPKGNHAMFPLDGPFKASFHIEKEDSSLKNYHFRALLSDKGDHGKAFEMTFDTPGSEIDRTLQLVLEGELKPEKYVRMSLKTPWKKFALEGAVVQNEKEQSLSGKYMSDGDEYKAKLGLLLKSSSGNKKVYSPSLELVYPEKKGKVSPKVKPKKPASKGITLEGTVTVERDESASKHVYFFDGVNVVTGKGKMGLQGTIAREGKSSYSMDMKVKYNDLKQYYGLKSKCSHHLEPGKWDDVSISAEYEFTSSEIPYLNSYAKWDFVRKPDHMENTLSVNYGPETGAHINNIHLSNLVLYKMESTDNFEISTKNSFSYPKLELDSRLEGSVSPTDLQFGAAVKYGQISGQSDFNLKFGKSIQEGYELKWEVDASGNGFVLDSKRAITSPKTSTVDVCLELKPGGRKYEVSSDVTHSYVGPKDFELAANTIFKIPGHEDYRLDSGMQVHPDNFKYHLEMHKGQVCHFDLNIHGDLSEGWCKKAQWNVLVKDHLEGSGHLNAPGKNNQKGDFVLNLLDINRKVKGEYSWVAVDGKISLVTDLFWDADKDASKKLHYEGVLIEPKDTNLLDMKNTFVYGDKTTRLNMKATKEGTVTSGVMTGSIDLILHNGRHMSYNGHYKMNLKPSSAGDSELDLSEVYCDQDPSGTKSCLNAKVILSQVNVEAGTYNFDVEAGYNAHDGKDIKFVSAGKSVSNDEKRIFDGEGSLGGSFIGDKKLQVIWGGECAKNAHVFHATGKIGEESLGFKASLNGNLDDGKTTVGEFHVEGHTSMEISQFSLGQKVKITKESSENFDFSSSSDLTWKKDQTLTVKAHVNRHGSKGGVSASVCLPGQSEDHGVSAEWNHDAGTPRVEGSLAVIWPQGKQIKVELQATAPKDTMAFHLIVHTPFKGHETMEILLNQKNLRSEHAMEADVTVIIFQDHKTTAHCRVEFPKNKFSVAYSMSQQGGPSGKLNLCLEKKGEKHFETELELDWGGEGNYIHAKSSAKLEGIDQFALHGYLDSPPLKVNKWSIDINSKQGGKGGVKGGAGGKRVVFIGKKSDEVVFQGSTSFSSKKEGNTMSYEGAGTLKMGGETKNANFKFSLTNHEDTEDGIEAKLSMGMTSSAGDKHAFIGEAKLSRKELKLYESYCRDNDKCSLIEAYSKVTYEDMNHDMNHDFAIIVDLKELINLIPVSMKGSTHRSVNNNVDHKMEVQFDKGKSKYSYHLYLKEHEAGAYLMLPERTIALVGHLNSEGEGKKEGGLGGFNADVTLWLDKERHPKLKTTGSVLFDASQNGDIYTLMFYGQFAHPSLGKPLAIRGESKVGDEHTWLDSKIEFDVFDKQDQTVIMCVKLHHEPIGTDGHNVTALVDLKSKGQNVDFEWVSHAEYANRAFGVGSFASYLSPTNQRRTAGALMRVSCHSFFIQVKAPTCEIFRVDTTMEISEPELVVTNEVSIFGQHTHVEKLEFKGLNSFRYHTYEKESPDDQFQVHGTLVWGDALQVHVDRAKGGQKEVLAHLGIALDQAHLFDVKHTWEEEKIKVYLSDAKNDFNHAVQQSRSMYEQMNAEAVADMKALMEMVTKSAPNLKPLLSSYQTQLKEMREELLKDPVFSQGLEAVRQAVNSITEALSQTIEKLTKMFEDLFEKWNAFCKEVLQYYEKMMPKVNEFIRKVTEVIAHELEKWGHYLVDAFERFIKFMGNFSGEFKVFGKIVVNFLQDVARTIGKLVGDIQHHYDEVWKDTVEHLKALPVSDFFGTRYEDLLEGFPLLVNETFIEAINMLIEMSPTPEIQSFTVSLKQYVIKKMNKEKLNDKAELEALYELFIQAVKSVVMMLQASGKDYQLEELFKSPGPFTWPSGLSLPTSFTYDDIARLPFFFAARFSPFYLDSDDFPRPSELLQYLWPSLPRGIFPPQNEYGILVGGEHFFTFDGRHYSLSGCACNYVLAQDFEDGNFSVAAHLEGGELKSVTLIDPNDSIVLNTDNTVLVNGKATNLPVRLSTVSAWTEFDSVSIKSDYGVRVTCDLRFKGLCFVTVNGYYFAKTRGLLGTVNNEPYDDFIMPNGKVAPSVDKLANSWKIDPSCSPVSAQTHEHEHVPQCSEMFAGFSSMRMCFPIVNPAGFREACDANVAMGGGDPCEVAAAYAIACRQEGVFVSVPSKCAQCSVGGNTVEQGHTVSLKAPQGKADIVIVVEQLPENEAVFKDLVVPLAGSLMNDLKAYKITDVKIVLIGFGGHGQKWPSIFTTNGQIAFDGKGENMKFEKVNEDKHGKNKLFYELPGDLKEYVRRLEGMRKLFNVEFGMVNYGETFQLVRDYPFRAGAARTVVAVLQSRCLYSPLPVSSQAVRLFFQRKQYEHAGISFHVITPLEFTATSKEAKQMKQAVGLDKNSMYTVADGKKKNLIGDTELRKEMGYNKDLCVDFAFATRGAAFSSSNFMELSKPGLKKQFIQVVSQRISQSLAPELTEDCTCKLYHGLHPVTSCWVTSRKERENLKVATKGVKG